MSAPPDDAAAAASAGERPVTPDGSPSRGRSLDSAGERLGEQSPLLSSDDSEDDGLNDAAAVPADTDDTQSTKGVWYLILLTISIGGLQIAWSVELSNGSPYLLSLGLSKSLMALVWIAGPLSGTLMQPYVGMLSDNCRIAWGKRKPYMLGGAAATMLSLMCLAWTREIVSGILGLFGADSESQGVKISVIVVAVIGVYVLDFAIATVQAAIRAFIVDCAPAHQQEAANGMASRVLGVGNIIGYIAGYVYLPKYLWWLGNTQFQILCAIASIALGSTVALSCVTIHERDPRLDGAPSKGNPNVFAFTVAIFRSIKRLPPQIRRVCQVQLCAWIGFFPFLFYTSSWIGEIYVQPYLEENPHMTPEELDVLYEQATRIGTFALLINSIVSLSVNVFLPFFIAPTYDRKPVLDTDATPKPGHRTQSSFFDRLKIPGFTIRRAWLGSLVLFAVAMFCTMLIQSVTIATVLIGIVGITWAMTLWAPFAIISAEISRRDAFMRAQRARPTRPRRDGAATPTLAMDVAEVQHAAFSTAELEDPEKVDQAGVILGIHNMAIAAPQIIATIASSIIFKIWQKPRGTPGDHSIAIVYTLGGLCILASAYFVYKIKDDVSLSTDVEQGAYQSVRRHSAGPRHTRRPGHETS